MFYRPQLRKGAPTGHSHGRHCIDCLLASIAPKEHYGILAGILNDIWTTQAKVTEDMMDKRIHSGSPIIVEYDYTTEYDRNHIKNCYGIDVDPKERYPIGILETIAIMTWGELDYIPKTYAELTAEGEWRPPHNSADTVILVDVTLLPTRRDGAGKGEGAYLLQSTKDYLRNLTDYQHLFTYSPDTEGIIRWHSKLGAKDTGHIIPRARPGFAYPDVHIMDYSEALRR